MRMPQVTWKRNGKVRPRKHFIKILRRVDVGREKAYAAEIETLRITLDAKEKQCNELTLKISEISNNLYEPRMVRLRELEKEVRVKLEEYALLEEAMETVFLCTKCAQLLQHPVTVSPCGTYHVGISIS